MLKKVISETDSVERFVGAKIPGSNTVRLFYEVVLKNSSTNTTIHEAQNRHQLHHGGHESLKIGPEDL